ncbi:MAG: hypothetical protein ACKO14_14625 [Armatimonadota bacterium]
MSLNIWTPDHGASGLIIIPKPTPILLVSGGRVQTWTPRAAQPTATQAQANAVDIQQTSSGILIVKHRQAKPRRIIGHPELATGATVRKDDTLYISISEAIYRQRQGEDVELHFTPTIEDEKTLAYTKEQVWKQWDADTLPDGWTRPRSAESPPQKRNTSADTLDADSIDYGGDLSDALRRLRRLRNR